MWDIKGILWGTVFTFLEIGLVFLVFNIFTSYILGISAMELVKTLETSREVMHQSAVSVSAFLAFITEKAFVQFMIFLVTLGIWIGNINFVDRKRSNIDD